MTGPGWPYDGPAYGVFEGLALAGHVAGEVAQIVVQHRMDQHPAHQDQLQRDLHNFGIAYEMTTPHGRVRIDPALMIIHQPGTVWTPPASQVRINQRQLDQRQDGSSTQG